MCGAGLLQPIGCRRAMCIDCPHALIGITKTIVVAPGATLQPLPHKHHMLCNEDGVFPAEMNDWEIKVLVTEMQHQGFQAWYRNPSRPSQDSLGIAYTVNSGVKILRPDFIFFRSQSDGSIAADIVDPHGTQFGDAIPKLQGLARYAEAHLKAYSRIESIAKVGDKLRMLDLTSKEVCKAVAEAQDARALYESRVASDY
jgi:type III restriction enzyme